MPKRYKIANHAPAVGTIPALNIQEGMRILDDDKEWIVKEATRLVHHMIVAVSRPDSDSVSHWRYDRCATVNIAS